MNEHTTLPRTGNDFPELKIGETGPLLLANEHHVYHHSNNDGASVNVKVEKNSKGYNWEATVVGAESVDEAIKLLSEAETRLKKLYGEKKVEE